MIPDRRKSMGYVQVIDNLVYHAILNLHQCLDNWDTLDNIANICSSTYDIPLREVITDYELELERHLVYMARE